MKLVLVKLQEDIDIKEINAYLIKADLDLNVKQRRSYCLVKTLTRHWRNLP